VALFGPNAVGKTTLATAIAEALPRAALIEVDALRYQRRGGLVAWSRGTSPEQAPQEYEAQCRQALALALVQARHYIGLGISICIEGLEDDCIPGSPWARAAWAGIPVHHLLLECPEVVAVARLSERGMAFTPERRGEHARWRALAGGFDQVVSTAMESPAALAERIVARLPR
jgi:predicted kinase